MLWVVTFINIFIVQRNILLLYILKCVDLHRLIITNPYTDIFWFTVIKCSIIVCQTAFSWIAFACISAIFLKHRRIWTIYIHFFHDLCFIDFVKHGIPSFQHITQCTQQYKNISTKLHQKKYEFHSYEIFYVFVKLHNIMLLTV
jgi:hypothetical protein